MNDTNYQLTPEMQEFMKNENLSITDIITPQEQANAIPITSSYNTTDLQETIKSPHRLENLPPNILNIVTQFELETNTIYRSDSLWDSKGYYFKDPSSEQVFMYKPKIASSLINDQVNLNQDQTFLLTLQDSDPIKQQRIYTKQDMEIILGADVIGPLTNNEIDIIVKSQPPGMPKLIHETENFYVFEDFMGTTVTPQNTDKEILDMFFATFTGDWGPFYSTINDNLYIKNNKMFFASLPNWYKKPTTLLGMYFGVKDNKAVFCASTLTNEQHDLIVRYIKHVDVAHLENINVEISIL